MKRLILVCLVITSILASLSVHAITYGEPDTNEDYPWVGLMIPPAPGGGFFLCSGSLIAPDVFLTAAHCLDNPDVYLVTFKSAGPYALPGDFIFGTPIQHPDWTF